MQSYLAHGLVMSIVAANDPAVTGRQYSGLFFSALFG